MVTENPFRELWGSPLAESPFVSVGKSWPSAQLFTVLLSEKMMVTIKNHESANLCLRTHCTAEK